MENFTLCDLNNFDSILGNIFLDAYGIDIFCNEKNMCKIDSKMVESKCRLLNLIGKCQNKLCN